ncbi:hypothetical protein FRB99_007436 [Tulasnella sp. 403]|nr:hypothetical protein FRB99_007436 [Tulasnella sp. 403]
MSMTYIEEALDGATKAIRAVASSDCPKCHHLSDHADVEADIQRRLESLELIRQAVEAEITVRTAQFKAHRNRKEPLVNRLPAELLINILHLAIGRPDLLLRQTRRLMLVSTLWHDTIASTPLFWSMLDILEVAGRDNMDFVLKKNPTGPLDVYHHHRRHPFPPDGAKVNSLWAHAAQQSSRWRSISITEYHKEILDACLAHVATAGASLKGLSIRYTNESALVAPHLVLQAGQQLQRVSLNKIAFSLGCNSLSSLLSLQLSHIEGEFPSLSELYDILSSSPNLQYLALVHLRRLTLVTQDATQTRLTPTPLFFPHLSALIVYSVPQEFSDHLLTHIDAPSCQLVAVNAMQPVHLRSPSFRHTIAPALSSSISEMVIHVYRNWAEVVAPPRVWTSNFVENWTSDDNSRGVSLSSQLSSQPIDWRELIDFLEPMASSMTEVSVEVHELDANDIFTPDTFALLTSLTSATFSYGTDPLPFLQRLTFSDLTAQQKWPCPRLTSLSLTWGCDSTLISDALVAIATARSSLTPLSPCATIQSITVPEPIVESLQRARALDDVEIHVCEGPSCSSWGYYDEVFLGMPEY